MRKYEMVMKQSLDQMDEALTMYLESGEIQLHNGLLTGKTYLVKDYIKHEGGKWNAAEKAWNMNGTKWYELMKQAFEK